MLVRGNQLFLFFLAFINDCLMLLRQARNLFLMLFRKISKLLLVLCVDEVLLFGGDDVTH